MPTATASISLRGSGSVTIHVNEGETQKDLDNLSDKEIVERIIDFKDILDNCIDENDIEVDDITLDR